MASMKPPKKAAAVLTIFVLLILFACSYVEESPVKGDFVRVAICQIFSLDGDRSGNFARIENAVVEAKNKGADVACFPETSLFGWVNPEAHERARPIPGEDTDRLCRLAEKYRIFLSVGLAEKEDDKLFDTAVLIDDAGKILLKHRKINILAKLMTPPYTPGSDIKVAETRFGRIGLLICADTFRDELLKRMAELEPDLVLVPYGWAAEEDRWPGHGEELKETVVEAARTIGAPVVGTDLVGEITHGPWTGLVYGGQSVAADSEGRILTVAADRDRDVKVVLISLN
jgi:predicted amidohydrolase